MAMHRAIPTKINPSLNPFSSGKKAHASANYPQLVPIGWIPEASLTFINTYHKKRGHNPIDNKAEPNLDPQRFLSKSPMQRFVSYLAQNRIHHD